jgi:hypothetical protein
MFIYFIRKFINYKHRKEEKTNNSLVLKCERDRTLKVLHYSFQSVSDSNVPRRNVDHVQLTFS